MNSTDKSKKKKKRKLSLRSFYYEMIKIFGGLWVSLYVRPKVYRISDSVPKRIKGGVIIAANHTSCLDPVALFCVFWYRRLYFPATEELFYKPINSFFFTNMNCIRIDRNSPNTAALKEMCRLLKRDKAVAIFPEGGINATDEMKVFKKGTAYMALRCNCPILPVYISKKETRREPTYIVIGEPVNVTDVCKDMSKEEAVERVSEYLRNAEIALAEYCDKIKK